MLLLLLLFCILHAVITEREREKYESSRPSLPYLKHFTKYQIILYYIILLGDCPGLLLGNENVLM